MKALIVDDLAVNRRLLTTLLKGRFETVHEAENGFRAVECFRSADYGLILMDVEMPELDGVAAARTIRELEVAERRVRTPIFALSGNVIPEQPNEFDDADFDETIGKPIDMVLLEQLVAKHCG